MMRNRLVRLALPVLVAFQGLPSRTAAAAELSLHGRWDRLIEAPASRILAPAAILRETGSRHTAGTHDNARLTSTGAHVTFDFGREVGGLVSFKVGQADGKDVALGLSFAESPRFIGPESDNSAGGTGTHDGALAVVVRTGTSYIMPADRLRGGFRYLTVSLNRGQSVSIDRMRLAISFSPGEDLRRYGGYFISSDPLLNRIWYAGAYTLQTNIVASDTGRAWPFVRAGWENNAVIGVGRSILVDGAKRDRTVWPGDMGIALPALFVSTNDLLPARNALQTLFDHQDPQTGALPECGPPLLKRGSDTYHLWTLIGTARYLLYSGDTAWLGSIWSHYRQAIAYSMAHVDATGLLNVTGPRDWGRLGQGGDNIEANVLLYEALRSGAVLARTMNDLSAARSYAAAANVLRASINRVLWDSSAGAYRDTPQHPLYPQDGNALAIWYGVTNDPGQNRSILRLLTRRWNRFGAVSVELPGTIAPFAGSMEVMARFAAHDDLGALEMIRREWGFMLDDPEGTRSTFLEGYLADGSLGYRGAFGYQDDPSYVSHSHGWSTGPTSALTFYLLGLQPETAAGRSWSLAPHPGDLASAEGAFTTPLGIYRASWRGDRHGHLSRVQVDTPAGTTGRFILPAGVPSGSVSLDGHTLPSVDPALGIPLSGGRHVVTILPATVSP